ncbi:MAG TPA: class I SAM-dependent methyltransferase [Roseiflexaceae bacterium]|jgi:ubiquinone/menaquinone biosynthesis C-methylase UbiE
MSSRNAAAIRAGRVDLRHGSAAALPYRDNTFDKAFAVNSMHHWPDTTAGLSELRRVLKPGGLVAITEQPRGAVDEAAVREIAEKLMAKLSAAGFRQIRMEFRPMRRATSTCALGVK